jgi:hypothetical protein
LKVNLNFFSDIYSESTDSYSIGEQCIYPTLIDGINNFLGPIIISNIILKILTHFVTNVFVNQLLTITIGLSLLFYNLSDDYSLFMSALSYIAVGASITQLCSNQKLIVWFICMSFVSLNELTILYNSSFIRLRSHIMLIVMKIISFNQISDEEIEKDHELNDRKNYYSAISYLLHPLSLLLGVWHPYRPDNTNPTAIRTLIQSIYYLLISVIFLLLSTCLVHYYIGDKLITIIVSFMAILVPMPFVHFFEICLTVYITALQFRFSHYFICFATQALLRLWNYK